MQTNDLLPTLFIAERDNIISKLRYLFKIELDVIEDLVSDTFLSAIESWRKHALPQNPVAWLHTVAHNKAINYLKKKTIFEKKLSPDLKLMSTMETQELEIVKTPAYDSNLAMIFALCNPCIPAESQVGLALYLVCGLNIQEIADAFATTKHVIYKRLERAKEKLKLNKIRIDNPTPHDVTHRIDNVLMTLYLLFSEGYYSTSENHTIREKFCAEAIRINQLLIQNPLTDTPAANALLALMYFHYSRIVARTISNGMLIPYEAQNEDLWDHQFIKKGIDQLNRSAKGKTSTRFHLEAGIAYWHTQKQNSSKWKNILDLYNKLLDVEYSPLIAMNQSYALALVEGKQPLTAEVKAA